MSSLDLTRDWLKTVLRSYPSKDRILPEVIAVLQAYRTLAVKTDAFTFDSGQTALLLLLHGTLPINFRGSTYHIPVHVWVPLEYPRAPPLAFVVPTKEMGVRKSREIDPSGRVREEVVDEWWKAWQVKDISTLLRHLADIFSSSPPVYARPPESRPPPTASGSTPSSPIAAGPSGPSTSTQAPPPPARPVSFLAGPAHPHEPLPQYRASPTPPPQAPQSPIRSTSLSNPPTLPQTPPQPPQSPPVPLRPGQTPANPPVPQRPYQPRPMVASPTGSAQGQQGPPYPGTIGGQQSALPQYPAQYAPDPRMAGWPPTSPPQQPNGHPPAGAAQPPSGYQPQPSQPAPQPQIPSQPQSLQQPLQVPAHPPPSIRPPDLLSSPNQTTASLPDDSSLPTTAPPPLPPSKPPPPSLLHLHSILLPHLQSSVSSLTASLHAEQARLNDRKEDLKSGEPAIKDEMARLEAVKKVCDAVGRKMEDVVGRGHERIGEMEGRGEVSVDEVVCGISIVHNQLIDLVAEDNAIEDTIYHLTRALDAERIDLDRFIKSIRSLAREQYMKRALIERILQGMGQTQGW